MLDGSESRVVSATGGEKGSKLPQLGAIDPLALLELAKVAGFGAEKYSTHNYLKGYDWTLSINAASRHLLQFANGEDIDPVAFDQEGNQIGSGLSHVAHAAWNCLALVSFHMRGIGTDNRVSTFLEEQLAQRLTEDFDHNEFVGNRPSVDLDELLYPKHGRASDFWYYEFGDTYDIEGLLGGAVSDVLFYEDEADEDKDIYCILNPEIFGEFKPVELVDPHPFKVGDKVIVYDNDEEAWNLEDNWRDGYIVSNCDWQADAIRVVDSKGVFKPRWITDLSDVRKEVS